MGFFGKKFDYEWLILLLLGAGLLVFLFVNREKIDTNRWNSKKKYYYLNAHTIAPTKVWLDEDHISHLGKPSNLTIDLDGAPLTVKIGQENIAKYITTTPDIRGIWSYDGKNLILTPEKDWLPSQSYKIKLNRDLFEKNAKVDSYSITARTAINKIHIEEFEVWHDAKDLKKFGLSSRVKTDFPMGEKVRFKLILNKKEHPVTIHYDQYKRYAFVNYGDLQLKEKPQVAELTVELTNGEKAAKAVSVPSIYDFAKLKEMSSSVLAQGNEEKQALILDFADAFDIEKVAKKLTVYLLPEKDPEGKDWNDTTLEDKVYIEEGLKKAEKLTLTPLKQNVAQTVSAFSYKVSNFPMKRYIYVVLEDNLVSESGLTTKEKYAQVLPAAEFKKMLEFAGDGNILSLKGSQTLHLVSRSVKNIDVKISKIIPNLLNVLLTQLEGDMNDEWFYADDNYRGTIKDEDLAEIHRLQIPLVPSAEIKYSTVELDKYLKKAEMGLFFVEVEGDGHRLQDENYETYYYPYHKRLVLVTDIALLFKQVIYDTAKVYAISVSTGQPLVNAKIEMLSRNGTIAATKYTNQKGEAIFKDITKFKNERKPIAFVATYGNDFSYIPVGKWQRRVDYSRYSTDGQYLSNYQRQGLDAFIFTDRGIYRPGEEVSFGIITKNKTWTSTAGLPVKVKVRDSNYKVVFEKNISLTAEGLADFHYPLSPTAPTGKYTISVYNIADEKREEFISEESFRVREFQEDNLTIQTRLEGVENKGWATLQDLTGKVKVRNLYGTAAQGNEVKATLSLEPTQFAFDVYKDYSFSDYIHDKKSNIERVEEELPTQKTSADGTTTFPIALSNYRAGTYKLTFLAEAFERESGAGVKALASKLVSPNPYIVGYKSAANLSFMDKDSQQHIDFVAINPNLEKIDLDNLKLTILSQQEVSVPVVQPNGSYRYQTTTEEKVEKTVDFKISARGSSFRLPTDKAGKYVLEINDENNKLLRVNFFVAGSSNVGYRLNKDAKLSLVLAQKEVPQGGTLTFNIAAPYEGTALVSIEKDKVYASKWITLSTNSVKQNIQLPMELEGDGYVNVSLLRSKNSKDVLASPYSFAMEHFTVSTAKRKLTPKISVPEVIKPGEKLSVRYSTSKPSKIILFGVNEGILQVARYQTPNPLKYLFRKSALEVDTYQIWDLILPEIELLKETAGIGGGADIQKSLLAAGLNPFARKRNKALVFWSGILAADGQTKTYTYEVPEYFNGKIRVMAIAVEQKAMGSSEKFVEVRAPITLSAGAPVAVAPKDVFDVGLKIGNNKEDGTDGKMRIKMTVSQNLEIVGDDVKEADVPYGAEKTVYFRVKALEDLGNGEVSFEVENQKEITSLTTTLSIRPAGAYRTDIMTGNEKSRTLEIKKIPAFPVYDTFAERKLAVSANPLVLAEGLNNFLKGFPHGCTEQIISQAYPDIILKPNTKQSKEIFQNLISQLRVRQKFSGGFTVWEDSDYISDTISIYVLQFLTDAKELGYPVPSDLFDKTISWATGFVSKKVDSLASAQSLAQAHYLLAKNGRVMTRELANLVEFLDKRDPYWQERVEGAYVAATYALLQNTEKAQEIIKKYKVFDTHKRYGDYDSNTIRNADYLYLVATHFSNIADDKHNVKVIKQLLQDIADKQYNTLSSGKTVRALNAYGRHFAKQDENLEVKVNGNPVALSKEGNVLVTSLPKDIEKIEVKNPNSSTLGVFYVLTRTGFENTPVSRASNGLEISKHYFDKYGKELDTARVGDDVFVKINLKTTGALESVSNVAITDILPGAFLLPEEKIEGNAESFSIREDRVLIYTTATPQEKEFSYKAKVVSSGTFLDPAVSAASLYDQAINATGKEKIFTAVAREQ